MRPAFSRRSWPLGANPPPVRGRAPCVVRRRLAVRLTGGWWRPASGPRTAVPPLVRPRLETTDQAVLVRRWLRVPPPRPVDRVAPVRHPAIDGTPRPRNGSGAGGSGVCPV